MKPPPLRYVRATTAEEAVDLLAEADGDARILAGGQSLVPMLRSRMLRPGLLVDIQMIDSLKAIGVDEGGGLQMGAMVTHGRLAAWAEDHGRRMLVEAAGHIGHPAIRTRGTVVGSLAHADPAAEWAAVALALEGSVDVVGPRGSRVVPVTGLFTGPFGTVLESDEMIVRARLPLPEDGVGAGFAEVAPRRGDPAIAAAAAIVRIDNGTVTDARIGMAGLGPSALRASSVEEAVIGLSTDADFTAAAREVDADIDPLADIHASEAYRRRIAPAVVARALAAARERAVSP